MAAPAVQAILDKAVAAHGGADIWRGLSGVGARLSAAGFLFATKGRPPLSHMRMWASASDPRFVFHDYPRPGWRGEWIGDAEVRIFDAEGQVVSRRERPREAFRGLRRQFRWDELDFLYFGGWARAAHLCEGYRDFGGLKAATKRRVWPTLFGDRPMSFPSLVALDIDEIRPQPATV